MDRNTWSYLEDGSKKTAEFKYAGIERALQWEPGSVTAILDGREPTPVTAPSETDDEEIELVRGDKKLTPEMRERIIALILERRKRQRAASLEETRNMIDLFRRG
jgi:hypothetical protein